MDILSGGLAALGATADIVSLAPFFSSPVKKGAEVTKRRYRTDRSMREAIDAVGASGELDYYADAIVRGLDYDAQRLADTLVSYRGQRSGTALQETRRAAEQLLADVEQALLGDNRIRVIAALVRDAAAQQRAGQARLETMMAQMLDLMVTLRADTIGDAQDREEVQEAEVQLRTRLESAVQALNEDRVEDTLQEVERSIEDLDLLYAFLPDDRYIRQSALVLKAQVYALRNQRDERDAVIHALRNGPPLVAEIVPRAAELAAVAENEEWLAELLPLFLEDAEERTYAQAALQWIRRDVDGTLEVIPDDTTDPDLLYMKAQVLTYRLAEEDPAAVAQILDQLDEADDLPAGRTTAGRLGTHLLQRVLDARHEAPGLDRKRLIEKTRARFTEAIEAYEPVADQHPIGLLEAFSGKREFASLVVENVTASRLKHQIAALQPEALPIVTAELADVIADDDIFARVVAEGNLTSSRLALLHGLRAAKAENHKEAKSYLRVALAEAESEFDYSRAMLQLGHLLLGRNVTEAAAFLGEDHSRAKPEDLAWMRVRLAKSQNGLEAALQAVDAELAALPRSLNLLRLKHDLLNGQAITLLVLFRQGRVEEQDLEAPLEARKMCANELYDILPCPKHKAQIAAATVNLDPEEADRLLKEAVAEGLPPEELPTRTPISEIAKASDDTTTDNT